MILVNFKLYERTFGDYSLELAGICYEVARRTGVRIIPIVSAFFANEIAKKYKQEVWVGHVDMYTSGKKTGYTSPLAAKIAGVGGTLLNHSEHQLKLGTIANTLAIIPGDFEAVVCVKSLGQAEAVLKKTKVEYLAYEPPYLIASKTASIASERIEVFGKIVEKAKEKNVKVLAGAGVKQRSDVLAVIKAGGVGVLVSSQVVESDNPGEVLLDLASGFEV